MLRLCHDLPRYSVDLDFWFLQKKDYGICHKEIAQFLKEKYQMTDSKNKHFTLLYEFKGAASERKLKIEIRKEMIKSGIEDKIAYSPFSNKQVLLHALSLEYSAKRKLLAIRSRNEMRDYFDLEFLLRRGAVLYFSKADKELILGRIDHFKKNDIRGTLGSLLEKDLREYYAKNGFSYLLEKLSSLGSGLGS